MSIRSVTILTACLALSAHPLRAGLTVTEVDGPPEGPLVRISQTQRDESGPTSFRYYAPREGPPTKVDPWAFKVRDGKPDGTVAKYFYRDRDLGQIFKTGDTGFRLGAITVRLQPVDIAGGGDPANAKVSVQLMKVTGTPVIHHNGTTATEAPNGTSVWEGGGPWHGKSFTNARWSTFATDWAHDPDDANHPYRWPIMHYSDDFIEGETYHHIGVARGGVIPASLALNDYLRWEFSGDARFQLEPNTRYAFLFMFDEPAAPGVRRNIPLSNKNVIPGGALKDVYPDGHAIRREGSSMNREEVFVYDLNDKAQVEASRKSATFPSDPEARMAIQPGTLGYPDVDTYRDLYFIIEAAPEEEMPSQAAAPVTAAPPAAASGELIWQIGKTDGSGGEFTAKKMPERYEIPADWKTRTQWESWPPLSSGAPAAPQPWNSTITYPLDAVPPHGCEFSIRTVDAGGMVPELAIFSNGQLAGILQVVGAITPNQSNPRRFGSTFTAWLPPQFLKAGENTLRIEKLPPIYRRDTSNRIYLDVHLDSLELRRLTTAPATPAHSRTVHLGSVYGSFTADLARVETVGLLWEWLGVAYSGNPIRASFWSNLPPQTHRRELLETAARFNMSPVLAFLTDKDSADKPERWIDPQGNLQPAMREKLDFAWREWGSLIQYYELSNEPCMSITHGSFDVALALARHIQETKPAHVKLVAPGYAFGGGHGSPRDWDADPEFRRRLEAHTEVIGGHAYGRSTYQIERGVLSETIDTYGTGEDPRVIVNGFPREFVVTETGSHLTAHEDFDNLGLGKSADGRLRASVFDKVLRAHIGFADRILHFACFSSQDAPFRMIDGNRTDPATWTATPFPLNDRYKTPEVDTKLNAFRRLALAYATHGAPLPFEVTNAAETTDQLVYFRAVDTSTLPPLPGSGATADKVLLSFVNFSDRPQRLAVRVELPRPGAWSAVRIGQEPRHQDARSELDLTAKPALDLTESLPPFAAVQFILSPPDR
jgi:hypothetical protein